MLVGAGRFCMLCEKLEEVLEELELLEELLEYGKSVIPISITEKVQIPCFTPYSLHQRRM